MIKWLMVLLLLCCCCCPPLGAQLGTTPHIKHIVLGRCYSYMALTDPSLRFDCEEIWREFEEAVVLQPMCNVTVKDFHPMFHLVPHTEPCDRFLFWSKTRAVMESYRAAVRHSWTLEDTLVGFMFNGLVWCRQEKHPGFDFGSCPEWSRCKHHPVSSLWLQASQTFAEMACGNITVLLNGSIASAFHRNSMLGSVELDNLDPQRVNYVNIKVVTNLQGPYIESCSKGSVMDLIQILRSRGFRWTCTYNDHSLMMLQCVSDPDQSICQGYTHSLSHTHSFTYS